MTAKLNMNVALQHCMRIVYGENIERSCEIAQWNWWNVNYHYKFTYLPKAGAYEQHEMWKIIKHLKLVRCTIFHASTMAMQYDFTCYLCCRLGFYTESKHWRIVFSLNTIIKIESVLTLELAGWQCVNANGDTSHGYISWLSYMYTYVCCCSKHIYSPIVSQRINKFALLLILVFSSKHIYQIIPNKEEKEQALQKT